LVIKAINSSKSVMADLTYHSGFFSGYRVEASGSNFKIHAKSCLQVFRSISTVESCKMAYDDSNAVLMFDLACQMSMSADQ
jgi:hypothetical protein